MEDVTKEKQLKKHTSRRDRKKRREGGGEGCGEGGGREVKKMLTGSTVWWRKEAQEHQGLGEAGHGEKRLLMPSNALLQLDKVVSAIVVFTWP